MASTSSSSRGRNAEMLVASRKWNSNNNNNNLNDRETSPERSKVWTEHHNRNNNSNKLVNKNGVVESRRVPVVYYLSRNGQLEHPHFMEVPLSSNQGLYLRDVINRLNQLRGKGMSSLYSWSAKRSYKNGFVWHDLSEEDLINQTDPNHHEYILKGSELLFLPQQQQQQISRLITSSINNHLETSSFRYPNPSEKYSDFPTRHRRNQSWSSTDLVSDYKVVRKSVEPCLAESTRGVLAADAWTQTEERNVGKSRRRPRVGKQEGEIVGSEVEVGKGDEIEEVMSPPPSDSSPETLESLMKADGRLVLTAANTCQGLKGIENDNNRMGEGFGRMKASTVLMQLISCGSLSFKDCGATAVKEQGLALIGGYKARLPRGGGGTPKERVSFPRVKLEDKEYFSGSLVETKIEMGEEVVVALKRSNSYNADRNWQLHLGEKDIGVHNKCIPRKSKAVTTKNISFLGDKNDASRPGSKKLEDQQVEKESKREERNP